jgi:hypothetical protein
MNFLQSLKQNSVDSLPTSYYFYHIMHLNASVHLSWDLIPSLSNKRLKAQRDYLDNKDHRGIRMAMKSLSKIPILFVPRHNRCDIQLYIKFYILTSLPVLS